WRSRPSWRSRARRRPRRRGCASGRPGCGPWASAPRPAHGLRASSSPSNRASTAFVVYSGAHADTSTASG
ncbi:MAG: hypothetical protein AVDCRST_MAG68-1174, partial [uncultured Gemmatimonadetes bacterium]